mgnify:FL=1
MSEESQARKCMVLGNGETLKDFDFKKIDTETMGICLGFKEWEKMDWYPDYYVCVQYDELKENCKDILKMIEDDKCKSGYLLSDSILEFCPELKENKKVLFLEDFKRQRGNPFVYLVDWCSGSCAVMFAVILGFNDIDIMGMDLKPEDDDKHLITWEHIVFILTGYTRLNNVMMNVNVWTSDPDGSGGLTKFFSKYDLKNYFVVDI